MIKKISFLLLLPVCASAQWLPTTVSFQAPNPVVNSKDSLRYVYPGKSGGYSYFYNSEFVRANYINNGYYIHVSSPGNLAVGPFTGVPSPNTRIYANSFTSAPTTTDLTNSITIGVGNVSAVNNRLGQIGFLSADADFTAPKMVAYIQGIATETYADNTGTGSTLHFFTGTNGGTSPVDRGMFDNNGLFSVNSLSPSLPVKTNASKQLVSSAIALAGSDVSGVLSGSNGGTGVSNSGKTITLGSSLTTVGAFASTFTVTGTTNVTFPQSGTLATTTTFAGANPTATAGTAAVNGVATTFMRSDAAPKVDTTAVRTVANSLTLAQLQTKFNGYVPTSRTITINGSALDLSANRSWSVGTLTSITPGWGHTSNTPITSSGTITVDSSLVATKSLLGNYFRLGGTNQSVTQTPTFNNGITVNGGSGFINLNSQSIYVDASGGGNGFNFSNGTPVNYLNTGGTSEYQITNVNTTHFGTQGLSISEYPYTNGSVNIIGNNIKDGNGSLFLKASDTTSMLQTIANLYPRTDARYYNKTISDGRYGQLSAALQHFAGTNTFANSYSTSSAPSVIAGLAAGTSPSIVSNGTNQDGVITITIGTTPVTGVIFYVTMSGAFAYPTQCLPVFQTTSATDQSTSGITFKASGSPTGFTLSTDTVLVAGGKYSFYYHNGGY